MNTNTETHAFHSTYKGHDIIKVTQESGRVTYDVYPEGNRSSFDIVEHALPNLRIVRATINVIVTEK